MNEEQTKTLVEEMVKNNIDVPIANLQSQINAFKETFDKLEKLGNMVPDLEKIAKLEPQLTQVTRLVKDFNSVGRLGKFFIKTIKWLAAGLIAWGVLKAGLIKMLLK